MRIKIIKNPYPEEGIEIGDIFEARRYALDPWSKFTLVRKIKGSDSPYKKESRNHYVSNCEILQQ